MEDLKIKINYHKYVIDKGNQIYLLPVSMYDEKLFSNPYEFDQSRYNNISTEGKMAITPYGGGKHL